MNFNRKNLEVLVDDQEGPIEYIKDVRDWSTFVIQINYAAGVNANAFIQSSLDYNPDNTSSGHWITVNNSLEPINDGANTAVYSRNVVDFASPFIKIEVDQNVANVTVLFAGVK